MAIILIRMMFTLLLFVWSLMHSLLSKVPGSSALLPLAGHSLLDLLRFWTVTIRATALKVKSIQQHTAVQNAIQLQRNEILRLKLEMHPKITRTAAR